MNQRSRRRHRRNIRRVRQRNRRLLLMAVLMCFIAWAGITNIKKQKEAEESKAAYAEQQKKEEAEKESEKEESKLVLAEESEKDKWYLKLVNAKNPMTEADVPEVETETLDSEGYQVDARIMDDLEDMFAAAREAGRSPMICSAFRSWDTQVSLYQNKISRVMSEDGLNEEDAAIKAATVVAKPGTSEHQVGLALDVDFSLFRPLEFFVDSKNGDGRNNNPPAMRVRVDCYTKKLPFRVQ